MDKMDRYEQFALAACRARILELEAALRNISAGAKRYWREGDDAYQFAILADAALSSGKTDGTV
jgi:hypothetical protein